MDLDKVLKKNETCQKIQELFTRGRVFFIDIERE